MYRWFSLANVCCGAVCLSLLIGLSGCGRQTPTAPKASPTEAAQEAMRLYDQNADGKISGKELDAVPAFQYVLTEMDTDKDKAISAPEIEARIQKWIETDSSLVGASCKVTFNGKPVASGTLILEPEPFMGSAFSVGKGEISDGICQPTTDNPGDYCAMPVGFYKARVEGAASGSGGIEIYDRSIVYQKSGVFPIELGK